LAYVSRAGYYRWQCAPPAVDADLDLRDEIQRMALEFPSYGWPRMTAELKRRGWEANHKRVYRIMREDNLLCLRRRKFVVTTDSNHNRQVYPNLARGMVLTKEEGASPTWMGRGSESLTRAYRSPSLLFLRKTSRRPSAWYWTSAAA
jgi:transposase InsO family protein